MDDLPGEPILSIAKAHGIPMSLIDGRPWVPTVEEMPGSDFPAADIPESNPSGGERVPPVI